MRVVVMRSGGFAGLRRTWSVDVDARSDAASWRDAVASLPWAVRLAPSGGNDRFVYSVTVEGDETPRAVTLGEAELGDEWRTFIERVRAAA